jgi:hypothetical protein
VEETGHALAELQEKNAQQREDRDRPEREQLRREKREIEQSLAADRARLQVMEKTPPVKTAEEMVGFLAKDAFHKADAVVEFRVKRLEELKERAKSGKATPDEVAQAEFAAADARLYSIAYTATITGMQTLAEYIHQDPNDPRPNLRANVAAAEAKLKVLDEQLAQLAPPATSVAISQAQLERAQAAASDARRDSEHLIQQIDQIRSRNRPVARPKIAVIGRDPS